ncbi:MAG: Inositol 2-dehydrogenase [Planctomycetes bacterium ADurb.Bin126]|nr:MAG: Inositol 2-dehydrogenase [Planctomycetes bacterium ADurb.Bin126]HOD83233.1 Gfo/Idh/MocA family oxidoreductase [Phycisphaerae bacterium]HQL71828.1 Gfo/Idh/MocA family oxidoreductase [Phycisphaerae bacterium]
MNGNRMTRRSVLAAGSGAVAAFTIVPAHVLGLPKYKAPSEKLNIAGIGVGGMGAGNLNAVAGSENIVALCDVDPGNAARTVKRYPAAKFWTDYRKMLEGQKDIDAVIIATPDHTHATISMAAMQAGKHVYTQKPLTHDVWESRMLAQAAAKYKVATQMGIQGHSMEGHRLIREWIEGGVIGEVREVDAWCSLTYYPWGHAGWSSRWGERPKEKMPTPDGMDWDLWIGPAPMREFHRAYHPATWRCWWDFGCGMMGDRGAHTLDAVFAALKLCPPTSVEATSCGNTPDVHPLSAIVTFRFPAREGLPPLKLTWYEGTRPPRPEQLEDGRQMGNREGGALFKGSKGMLAAGVYGESPRLIPEQLMKEAKLPPKTLERIKGSHEMNWVAACKGGPAAGADFAYSGPLTEVCLLGNVAKRLDARIEWDPVNMKSPNLPAADEWIRRPRRKGWEL